MSSCLSGGGGGRTYGFDLDLVKPPPPASSRSSHTSSPSSTLSESSNSALAISIKKARTPRKRPNQTYNEAAALLSTIYPNVFSTKGLKKVSKSSLRHFSFPEPTDLLLPPLPVLFDAAFLLHKPHLEEPFAAAQIEFNHKFAADKDCRSPASSSATCSFEPNSPGPFDDDFAAESILDEEVEEGIDSIMGNLSVSTPSEQDNNGGLLGGSSSINPLLRSLVGCRISGSHTDQLELGLGLGLGLERNLQWALKAQNDCEWWRTPTVPVQNSVPNFKLPASKAASEKKKKKVEKEKLCYKKITDRTVSTDTPKGKLKASLGLKLNHEEVLKEWSDRSSMFLDGADAPESSVNALAKLADLDLLSDASGERETSVKSTKRSGGVSFSLRKSGTKCKR